MTADSALWPALLPMSQHGEPRIRAVSARDNRVRFDDGRTLLCGTSGLWNVNLGYGNEHIASAIGDALRHASYLSVFRYENTYAREAADRLISASGFGDHFDRVVFSTSGGAVNDAGIKIARQTQAMVASQRKDLVVALTGSYHGLTFGAFALTGEDLAQSLYGVDRRSVRHVPPNDVAALRELMAREGDRVAAMIVEPVLGTGAVVVTDEYLRAIAELRAEHRFILVADEVATGFHRIGPLFASTLWPTRPDLLMTSKGLTNGTCAAAAMLVSRRISAIFAKFDAYLVHGETQAGTPPSAAAITATLDELTRLDAAARSDQVSRWLTAAWTQLRVDTSWAGELRGAGAFRAAQILGHDGRPVEPALVPIIVAQVREAGAIVHPGVDGIQLIPSLIYTGAEIGELCEALRFGVDRALNP